MRVVVGHYYYSHTTIAAAANVIDHYCCYSSYLLPMTFDWGNSSLWSLLRDILARLSLTKWNVWGSCISHLCSIWHSSPDLVEWHAFWTCPTPGCSILTLMRCRSGTFRVSWDRSCQDRCVALNYYSNFVDMQTAADTSFIPMYCFLDTLSKLKLYFLSFHFIRSQNKCSVCY